MELFNIFKKQSDIWLVDEENKFVNKKLMAQFKSHIMSPDLDYNIMFNELYGVSPVRSGVNTFVIGGTLNERLSRIKKYITTSSGSAIIMNANDELKSDIRAVAEKTGHNILFFQSVESDESSGNTRPFLPLSIFQDATDCVDFFKNLLRVYFGKEDLYFQDAMHLWAVAIFALCKSKYKQDTNFSHMINCLHRIENLDNLIDPQETASMDAEFDNIASADAHGLAKSCYYSAKANSGKAFKIILRLLSEVLTEAENIKFTCPNDINLRDAKTILFINTVYEQKISWEIASLYLDTVLKQAAHVDLDTRKRRHVRLFLDTNFCQYGSAFRLISGYNELRVGHNISYEISGNDWGQVSVAFVDGYEQDILNYCNIVLYLGSDDDTTNTFISHYIRYCDPWHRPDTNTKFERCVKSLNDDYYIVFIKGQLPMKLKK